MRKVVKSLSYLHADSGDYDQTGRISRLISVFAGRRCTSLVYPVAAHMLVPQSTDTRSLARDTP